MSGRSRLALAKTARYCVLERRGDARSVRAAPGSSSRGRDRGSLPNGASPKQQEKTAAVGGRDAPSRPAQSSRRSEQTGAEEASSFPGTERLYMLDTYLMSAEATVIGTARDEKQGLAVILDRTIFHPQGGGQPSDCGSIACGSCTVFVRMVRDVGGVIHHFGEVSGSPGPSEGDHASLSLDTAKRLRHAVLHSAGHAVDVAMVTAVGPGVFSPLKGYHFEDSPYVEYRGKLPDALDKDVFTGKLNTELDKLVAADMGTVVEVLPKGTERSGGVPPADTNTSDGPPESPGARGGVGAGDGAEAASRAGGGAPEAKHVAATRIVTVAGLACPCGGTHVGSTGQLEGLRVTKVKAKKGTLRVSYVVSPPSA